MATKLTSPVPVADITDQGVTKITFSVPHKRSADGTSAVIDKQNASVRYEVSTWSGDGKLMEIQARTVPFSDWPANFILQTNDVYKLVVADAKANNLIRPGTDEEIS